MTVTITNAEEGPSIDSGPMEKDYDENDTSVVATYTASDDEDDFVNPSIPLVWSLGGIDAAAFTIEGGVLKFNSSPDYESPTDVGSNANDNIYEVTIQVDDSDTPGASLRDMHALAVTVINLDEAGTVSLSARQPKEGTPLMATLSDPDRLPADTLVGITDINDHASTTWQWARCSSPNGRNCTDIEATETTTSTTRMYTPTYDDVGDYLYAKATYRDGQGDDKPASKSSEFTVLEKEYVNTAPMFPDDDDNTGSQITLMVDENNDATTGDPVGDAVVAEDIGRGRVQERLTYALSDGVDDEVTVHD